MFRTGEFAGLTINDIDMKKHRINIDQQLKYFKNIA